MPATLALLLLLVSAGGAHADALTNEAARARVDHHLRHVQQLASHFEAVMSDSCPRFASRQEWDAYIESESDHVVLLMAHLEQAWLEAKRAPDDDVRRVAKAPRRGKEQMQKLVDKFAACAQTNGAPFEPFALWRRIERDVPRRQAEVALPQ